MLLLPHLFLSLDLLHVNQCLLIESFYQNLFHSVYVHLLNVLSNASEGTVDKVFFAFVLTQSFQHLLYNLNVSLNFLVPSLLCLA